MGRLKDKLYFYFAEKNWGVRREYGPYVDAHKEEHRTHRIKHWWLLVRLNWHYRILRRKDYLLDFSSMKKTVPVKSNSSSAPVYLSPQNRRYDRFRFIHEIWNTAGTTKDLISMLRLWEQSWWCWKNDNPEVFLIYICCLLEIGERNEAKRVLQKYIDNIGIKEIHKYMPVSQLYVEMGYHNFTIEKSAFVFEQLEKNRNEKVLDKLLAGKSIAVVGNGPSEKGKKRGDDIDSHDIVIRFNNFALVGFEEDYGHKTNIWVRNAHKDLKDWDIIDKLDFVLWEADYWHIHIQYNHLDLMYRDIRCANNKLGYLYGLRQEICSNSSVLNPTTGLQIVYYLEKNREQFAKLDYYGFSFLDPESDMSYTHYYNAPTTAHTDHQASIEIELMRKLVFKEHNADIVPILSKYNITHKIYACAFRDYDVKKGKTGGPGGVLAMQRTILGDEFLSCPIEYLFMPEKITYPAEVQREINSIAGKLRGVIQGAYFIQSHPDIKHDLERNITPVLMCHDIGTAYGAFLLGLKYCVVYHQQGSILNELIASGGEPTEYEIDLMNRIEKRVLKHAVRVYFPSLGAQQVLINTSENVAACPAIPYSKFALYNTIPDVDEEINYELIHSLGIPKINKEDTEVFFSCGDFNFDKGMERIPEFLTEYAKRSKKKVVWIGIGSAGAYGIFEQLNSSKNTWPFESYLYGARTNHSTLLALMEYCDYYIMLHRNSIFDLATLEAMRAGAALILSPTGGNLEFNVENNVVYVEPNNYLTTINEMMSRNYEEWSESNKRAFNTHFSHVRFADNYRTALSDLLNNAGFKAPENKTYDDIITVTGIFTENYRAVVELQKQSCKDNYRFDYRFITDEEWAKAKTSNEFAFYGGNTIKTQLVIDKIKEYWGQLLLVCDADVVFLKHTEDILRELLAEQDMVFLRERGDSNNPFEKTPLNINIGFVLMRCNEKSLRYWELVQERTKNNHGWDQEEANLVLIDEPDIISWSLLPKMFLNGGDINKSNVRQQFICTGCGAVAKRNKLEKDEYLNQIRLMATGKRNTWFDGDPIE